MKANSSVDELPWYALLREVLGSKDIPASAALDDAANRFGRNIVPVHLDRFLSRTHYYRQIATGNILKLVDKEKIAVNDAHGVGGVVRRSDICQTRRPVSMLRKW